ncbi:MAG TPA: hypothetical protein VJV79_17590, partial [Polyangiaceae bacterium]|nr:hypothetical protein [Polyangiaceae bacterium]
PISLPTPAEVAARAVGLKRLFSAHPLEVREALRRYFVDGRIVVTPVAEGYYVAEGRFLPLVALVDSALDLAPRRGPQSSWYFGSCAGAIRSMYHEVSRKSAWTLPHSSRIRGAGTANLRVSSPRALHENDSRPAA